MKLILGLHAYEGILRFCGTHEYISRHTSASRHTEKHWFRETLLSHDFISQYNEKLIRILFAIEKSQYL
jgi:hypothetical protein